MAVRRCGAAAMAFQGQIFVLGGRSSEQRVLGSCESLSPISGIWQPAAPLKAPRVCAAAAVIIKPL